MSRFLTLNLTHKRNVGTLNYHIITTVQGSQQSVEELCQPSSLILSKIVSMGLSGEVGLAMARSNSDKALDTFVGILGGDLFGLLGINCIVSVVKSREAILSH